MEENIVIYTRPETLLHKMGFLPSEDDPEFYGQHKEYVWELTNEPKNLDDLKKIYFATRGFICGYFDVNDVDFGLDDVVEIIFSANSWTPLDKLIPTKQFRGFKYARNVEELQE